MAEEFANKIKRLELENFTCFGKVAMDFSPGINVIIGENGTGKTHLLKVLFLITNQKLNEEFLASKNPAMKKDFINVSLVTGVSEVLIENYYPPTIKAWKLIKKTSDARNAKIKIVKNAQTLWLETDMISIQQYEYFKGILDFGFQHDAVFIPSQEMISWFERFADLYENVDNTFDPTYYFMAKALSRPYPKGNSVEKAKELVIDIEKAIDAKVRLETDGRFYFYFNDGNNFVSPQVATGINKLAQLIQLTMNGAIHPGSILIWDEPEAGLNPKYIKPVVQFLLTLANAGCQIFVATHDYLLPYHLSLSVEYADVMKEMKQPVPPMKFFSLYKGEDGTKVEEGDTMPSIHHDAIMEGHSFHNEFEKELFRKSVNQGA